MTRNKWLLLLGVPLIFVAAWACPHIPGHEITPCAVKHMLGIDCPGCGITRSVVALVHGELRESVDLNPMGIVAAVVMTYLWLKAALAQFVLRRGVGPLMSPGGIKLISAAFVAGLFIQWFVYLGIGICHLTLSP